MTGYRLPQPPLGDPTGDTLQRFQQWLRGGGMAATTAHDWPRVVDRASRVIGVGILQMTTEEIAEYLSAFDRPNTRQTYFNGLASFHRWAHETGRRADNPMAPLRRPRVPRGTPHPVSTAGLQRLLGAALPTGTRAAVILAAYAGLRVHEIAKFRGQDLDLDEEVLTVEGKGGVQARLPMHQQVTYVAGQMPRSGFWFPSQRLALEHKTSRGMSTLISLAMRASDVTGTPHSLRHWYATHLLRNGADAVTVQELMRHATLAATQVYVKADPAQRRAAVLRLPDLTPI